MQSYYEITAKFYSEWVGTDVMSHKGINFIYSEQRNTVQNGYSMLFDLYIFYQKDSVIISYGKKALEQIDRLKSRITVKSTLDTVKLSLEEVFNKQVCHNVKYYFNVLPQKRTQARVLNDEDYMYYLDFFSKNNPNCSNMDWLETYFKDMVKKELCCGVFEDDMLVCCSDSPNVPYLADTVCEIGVNTIEDYRRKGYATDVCITSASHIINNGKCPIWSAPSYNEASQRLAEKCGFIKFADVVTIAL